MKDSKSKIPFTSRIIVISDQDTVKSLIDQQFEMNKTQSKLLRQYRGSQVSHVGIVPQLKVRPATTKHVSNNLAVMSPNNLNP
jgi:hypothetical protein